MQQMMVRLANRSEDILMLGVGKSLDAHLAEVGKAAVREIVTEANRLGVGPNMLPYVFWALATKAGLPRMGQKEFAALDLMVFIMERTGTMPAYRGALQVADDPATDSATDSLALHMATWSLRSMYPALLTSYKAALKSQEKLVPKLTNGQVKKGDEFEFLRKSFRQVLSLQSSMFRDGELLRRVVRLLPL